MVGRLPVTATLQPLDKKALLSILTKPQNAISKQYARLLEMDGVKLKIEDEALKAAVDIAITRKTGARALRSIFEKAMLDVMYDIPSHPEIAEVVITAKTIKDGKKAKLIKHSDKGKKAS